MALYRQTRILGVLLILQVVGMVGIGVWLFTRVNWDRALVLTSGNGQVNARAVEGPWLKALELSILFGVYFLAPVVLLLLAGLGFILLRRRGWMLASVAQALIMLFCLFSFPDPRPGFAYPIIAYCILMIFYLNSQSVRTAVHSKRRTPVESRSEAALGE